MLFYPFYDFSTVVIGFTSV